MKTTSIHHEVLPLNQINSSASSPSQEQVYLKDANTLSNESSHSGLLLSILGLASSAILPVLLGLAFYYSLGLTAPHGQHLPNGTYLRPTSEGFSIGKPDSWASSHFSPLLVSSISSTLIGMIAPLVMMLLGFHLAHYWLRASQNLQQFNTLPSPFQYFLTMNFISNSSLFSILQFFWYASKPKSFQPRLPSLLRRKSRANLSPILIFALVGLLIVLGFSWAIKILDISLHDQIIAVVQNVTRPELNFKANAEIVKGCEDPVFNTCGVLNRTSRASAGGANTSEEFNVYEISDRSLGNMAFMGPVQPDLTITVKSAHTYVAGTICEAFHPVCDVSPAPNYLIQACGPAGKAPHGIGPWNAIVYKSGFNTSTWRQRLQTFITVSGNIWNRTGSAAALKNGANINPFTTATFGCFSNFQNIVWNDTNTTFHTPLINWWSYGQGIPNQPYIMCSILLCNTSVYDAQYTLSQGRIEVLNQTINLANSSATLAISGSAVFLGTDDTDYYQYAPRFLDDQLQVDLTSAGNRFGNDSKLFANAWAQALSNRLIGWSLGAIELKPIEVELTQPQIATSIPLWTAYTFVCLHFIYAFIILLLGFFTLLLPGVLPRGSNSYTHTPTAEQKQILNHEDLNKAKYRLSDPTTLIHELMSTKQSSEKDESFTQISSPFHSHLFQQVQSNTTHSSSRNSRLESSEGEKFKVALVPDSTGGLELNFFTKPSS
ncbi:hypothetical protein CROQUDRAFT_663147 [Cronartium quercuum f. sp. fusiforme G11]|uniref:Uncharacterized protein n=1 Tax=Cronartium quercuum f. sp. fusiforme G11 TaxID=708437 RepID=A0A9P6T8X5_9BASI|nr:hypothetical protein CROQUDRAFT_663147 [Cronartium quercuum f. sp. fusiforme G11]